MDIIPPAIARIANMGVDHSGIGRNALTPVLKRDDAMKEWERRQGQGGAPPTTYPQLEYLQQQAERMPATWSSRTYHGTGGAGPSKMSLSVNTSSQQQPPQFQPPPAAHVVDSQERPVGLRDVMSSVRSAATGGLGSQPLETSSLASPATSISTPPLAYTSSTGSSSGHRYGGSGSNTYQQSQSSSLAYDGYDQRSGGGTGTGDLSQLYTPMQPHQYQSGYSNASSLQSGGVRGLQQQQHRQGTMSSVSSPGSTSAQPSAASLYAPGVSPSLGQPGYQSSSQQAPQQQRTLYGAQLSQQPLSAGGINSDGRRANPEMDVWTR